MVKMVQWFNQVNSCSVDDARPLRGRVGLFNEDVAELLRRLGEVCGAPRWCMGRVGWGRMCGINVARLWEWGGCVFQMVQLMVG